MLTQIGPPASAMRAWKDFDPGFGQVYIFAEEGKGTRSVVSTLMEDGSLYKVDSLGDVGCVLKFQSKVGVRLENCRGSSHPRNPGFSPTEVQPALRYRSSRR